MIYELRTYRLKVGAVPAYITLVQDEGLAIQKSHLGQLIGYFSTDIGELNQIVHLWAFDSLDDRERRRAALLLDPGWLAFLPRLQALIETMECKIMKPTPFSPLA
ncbi:MAG: NIPSNAP family protein [Pseudomonadota bacterium]